jgi:hypothetical protein
MQIAPELLFNVICVIEIFFLFRNNTYKNNLKLFYFQNKEYGLCTSNSFLKLYRHFLYFLQL